MFLEKLRVLDLFSGIGGFSLGLEATGGFETAAFCEMNEYADKVLEKHWPDIMSYEDVKIITNERLQEDGIEQIDVICGGFPCQDISTAGKGAGLSGERSGLWFEYLRIIDEVGPAFVVIENVSALRSRGLSIILQNLCEIGYDAEWHCIPASYVGAPHRRDRIWIVAYPKSKCGDGRKIDKLNWAALQEQARAKSSSDDVADTISQRGCSGNTSREDATNVGQLCGSTRGDSRRVEAWDAKPDVGRVANGIPSRVDRLKCLGNAVVPQIPEMIGYAILEAHNANRK